MPYTRAMRAFLLAACLAVPPVLADSTYTNGLAWQEDATTLGYQIDAFDKCRGRLAETPRFSGCIKLWEDAYRRWNRMDAYAAARVASDSANFEALNLSERSKALGRRLDEAAEFLQPEVRKLGRAKVSRMIASEKLLAKYQQPLDGVLRAKPGAPVDPRALWRD